MTVKRSIALLALLGSSLTATLAHAAPPEAAPAAASAAPMGKQQSRMASCNADAMGLKGDERKAFMKTCLSNEKPKPTQQAKMKSCNADAKDLKGDERKAFMKKCLAA